jgi:hypothetical protein
MNSTLCKATTALPIYMNNKSSQYPLSTMALIQRNGIA